MQILPFTMCPASVYSNWWHLRLNDAALSWWSAY